MARVYYDKNGNPNSLPVGIDDAKIYKSVRFLRQTPCPNCGYRVFYTKDQTCQTCARHNAADLYAFCVGAMSFVDIPPEYGGTGVSTSYKGLSASGDRDVSHEHRDAIIKLRELFTSDTIPTSITEAIKLNQALWIRPEPCNVAGHFGIRTITGRCYQCEAERKAESPRSIAIKEGRKTYVPLEPCKKCGQTAKRSVINGSCSGCNESASDRRKSPDTIMMESAPDMIISKAEATTLGFKVYRTGKPCRKGHNGFRYVSTNSCIDCLRGKE